MEQSSSPIVAPIITATPNSHLTPNKKPFRNPPGETPGTTHDAFDHEPSIVKQHKIQTNDPNSKDYHIVNLQMKAQELFSSHSSHSYHKDVLQGLESIFGNMREEVDAITKNTETLLAEKLPDHGMTENEEDEGDGEGGDAERIPDGFTLLDETKFVLVPARFKEYRETLGKYVEAGSRTETYQEKVESYPFHFILYRKASDSVDYVRVSEIHYMKLDELESCLMADGVDDKERDQKLLDRYSMAWESEDPEDDANLITTRNLKKLVAQKKSQHKHGPALVEPTGKTSTQRVKSAKVPRVQLDTQEEYDPSGKTTLADMMNKKEEGIKRAKQSHEDNLKWIRALAQFEIYLNMAESACRPLRVQYDPTIRFWDPIMTEDHDEIPIRFECSSYLSKYALAALVHMALKPCRLRANIEIVGAKDDGKNQQEKEGYFLIGSHLLNFYRTYTTEGGLRTLQRLGQHGPLRPFPNPKQVKEVGMLLKIPDSKNGDTRQDTQTQIAVTLLNTVRKKRGISQQQIASVSATILAQKFGWPANSLTSLKNKTNTGSEEHKTNDDKHEKAPEPSKASDYSQSSWSNQAEWLHRSAYSYGKFQTPGKHGNFTGNLDPQQKGNLFFGTKQANTFMMRPEASVKNIARMRAYKLSDQVSVNKTSMGPVEFGASSDVIGWSHIGLTHTQIGMQKDLDAAAKKFRSETKCWVKTSFDAKMDARTKGGDQNWLKAPGSETADVQTAVMKEENYHIDDKGNLIFDPEEESPVPPQFRQRFVRQQEEKDNCWYLTDCLVYDIFFKDPAKVSSHNKRIIIDPFSVCIPLRLEAELDKLVETAVFASHRLPKFEQNPNTKITIIE